MAKKRKSLSEINVVPYIDVMLVLLVIFMITAPLMSQGVKVNLPQANAKVLTPEEQIPIIVTVAQDGQYYLNIAKSPKTPISAEELNQTLAFTLKAAEQKQIKREVYVQGDREANYGKVVQAMVLLQKAGVDNVGLMTENEH